jgi:hypothetical protein
MPLFVIDHPLLVIADGSIIYNPHFDTIEECLWKHFFINKISKSTNLTQPKSLKQKLTEKKTMNIEYYNFNFKMLTNQYA